MAYIAKTTLTLVAQTIALASTQFLQPFWDLNAAQPAAADADNTTSRCDQAAPSGQALLAAALAQTPQKGHLLRAASPLLEEMLESPVTACKPRQAATAALHTPGRHALYQDVLANSSSCPQDLLSCQLSNYTTDTKCSADSVPADELSAPDCASLAQGSLQELPEVLTEQALSSGSGSVLRSMNDATGSASAGKDCVASDGLSSIGDRPQEGTDAAADTSMSCAAPVVAQAAEAACVAVAQAATQCSARTMAPTDSISTGREPLSAHASDSGGVPLGSIVFRQSSSSEGQGAELDTAETLQGKQRHGTAVRLMLSGMGSKSLHAAGDSSAEIGIANAMKRVSCHIALIGGLHVPHGLHSVEEALETTVSVYAQAMAYTARLSCQMC